MNALLRHVNVDDMGLVRLAGYGSQNKQLSRLALSHHCKLIHFKQKANFASVLKKKN